MYDVQTPHPSTTRALSCRIGYDLNSAELQRRKNNKRLAELGDPNHSNLSVASTSTQVTSVSSSSRKSLEDGDRCFLCFVADAKPCLAEARSSSSSRTVDHSSQDIAPDVQPWLRLALWAMNREEVARWWGASSQKRGMLGSVVYDTFGYHIPAKYIEGHWHRRRNVGYISNLAVLPGARRQGIASMLVARCEEVAMQDAKVEAVALHVTNSNGVGRRLYEVHGYCTVDESSEWKDLLPMHGNNNDLVLMIKRIKALGDGGQVEDA